MLVAVALVHLEDQLLANIARKVQVDVRHGLQVFIQEATEEQSVSHWINMAQPDEVANN